MSSLQKSSFSSFIHKIIEAKKTVVSFLFRNSEKRKKVFEILGYILVSYHAYKFTQNYLKNRGISSNYKKDIQKYKNPNNGKNWIVIVITNRNFSVDNKFMKAIGKSDLSIFFSKLFYYFIFFFNIFDEIIFY